MPGFPKFEGRTVAGGRLKLNGLAEDLYEPLKVGATFYTVIEGEIIGVDHDRQAVGDTLVRVHTAKIIRSGDIGADLAEKLLNQAEELRARQADEAAGREPLPLD